MHQKNKLVTTLKEIIEDETQQSINNPGSFIDEIRQSQARNCRIMIEAGIDENTDYIKAKEMYFEKYPEKNINKGLINIDKIIKEKPSQVNINRIGRVLSKEEDGYCEMKMIENFRPICCDGQGMVAFELVMEE